MVGYGLDCRVVEYVALAFGEGRPCLVLYALLPHEGVCLPLLEEGVGLNLVHGRLHLVVQEEVLQAFVREARHADGAYAALLVQAFGGAPCGVVVAVRLVQQVQVQVVEAELFHRQVEGAQRVVILIVLNPQLGGYEHVLAPQSAVAQCRAHFLLVEV